MSLHGLQEVELQSVNGWVTYQIHTLEHSILSFFSHPGEFKRDLSEFSYIRPSASVDNTLLDLQNSSYATQPHSIIANYK